MLISQEHTTPHRMNGCKLVSFLDTFRFQPSFFYPDGAVIRGRQFIRHFNSPIQFGCRYIASSVWGYKAGYRVCSRASGKLLLQSSSSPLECGEAYFSLFEVHSKLGLWLEEVWCRCGSVSWCWSRRRFGKAKFNIRHYWIPTWWSVSVPVGQPE
jgi:hypothetical protein